MEARERIRELLVRGDNRLKHGPDARSLARARSSYEEALALAHEAGLAATVSPIVEVRLTELARLEAELGGPSA